MFYISEKSLQKSYFSVPVIQWSDATLRAAGVAAIQRGRARAAYPAAAAAAAAAFARHPAPLTSAALHGYAPVLNTLPVDGSVYYDPFLAAHAAAASADPNYTRLQVIIDFKLFKFDIIKLFFTNNMYKFQFQNIYRKSSLLES